MGWQAPKAVRGCTSFMVANDLAQGDAAGLALAALTAYQQRVQRDGSSLYERGVALVETICQTFLFDRAGVFLLNPSGKALVGLVGVDSNGDIKPMPEQQIGLLVDAPLAAVAGGKIPYFVSQDTLETMTPGSRAWFEVHVDPRIRANAVVPIRDFQGRIVGVIAVDQAFSGRVIDAAMLWPLLFLGATAGTLLLCGVDSYHAGSSLDDVGDAGAGSPSRQRGKLPWGGFWSDLELLTEAPAKALRVSALEQLIRAVTGILELRDIETAGHTQRVTDLAGAIGVEMGLSERQLLILRRVAFLHDVGKIAIPDSILRKPGPLDAEEWAIMKRHPVASYLVASGLPGLADDTLLGIIQHHERWNGGGYPFGLRQEEIHWAARTFAVADSFEAMTSDRVYKPAKTLAVAREEICSLAGSQYDPVVVEAFLRLPAEFLTEWRAQQRLTPLSGALANLFTSTPGTRTPGQGTGQHEGSA